MMRGAGLSGNWATLLLPINSDDTIDFSRLAAEIDHLVSARVDGIYSNGTAGEFHNQTDDEFDAIQMVLAERCRAANMAFIIGACQPDPHISIERVRRAATLRPAAIQVIVPDWWPLTPPEATRFLEMAAEAAQGIPLVLYNPPHAKRVYAPAELEQILRPVPAVAGVKLADGDTDWYRNAREHLSDWAIFVPGHHLATGIGEGVASGAFSNVACLNPSGAQRWTRMMSTDLPLALEIESRLRAYLDTHIAPFAAEGGYSNAALDKLLAAVGGWADIGTRLRQPYRWIDPSVVPGLHSAAIEAIPEIMT